MQKLSVSIVVMSALVMTGCVSESTYVGSDRPVHQRQVNNTEAARTRMSLGLNYLQRGENAQAIYNLERARIMAPQLPEVYNALAYYYQSVGENEQAEAAYKQALARDADNADTYNNYGAFLCQIDKYEEAERLLLNAIRRPGYMRVSESYENLAMCMLQQDNFGRAYQYLESSVVHSSNRISSLLNLAALEYAMGNNQAARQHLTRIQRLGYVSANTALLSYLIADKELNEQVMKTSRELLLQVYPDSEPARLMLQQKLEHTEYEQLRERYKQYLISQIELPAEREQAQSSSAPSDAAAQPQIRIVRKNSPAANQTVTRSESLARPLREPEVVATQTATVPTPAPTVVQVEPVPAHETAGIAALLATRLPELSIPELTLPAGLPDDSFNEPAAAIELQSDAVVNDSSSLTTQPAHEFESQESVVLARAESELASMTDVAESSPLHEEDAVAATRLSESEPQHSESVPRHIESVPYHIVQEGESLFAISVQYNIRLERLQQWNNLTPGAVIRSGQRLWLAEAPAELLNEPEIAATERPDFHIVARGDTLFSISMRYNVRLSRLLHWNNLTERSRVYVGQQIYLNDPADLNHDD
jgi:type IV pilus assembly protein PilF